MFELNQFIKPVLQQHIVSGAGQGKLWFRLSLQGMSPLCPLPSSCPTGWQESFQTSERATEKRSRRQSKEEIKGTGKWRRQEKRGVWEVSGVDKRTRRRRGTKIMKWWQKNTNKSWIFVVLIYLSFWDLRGILQDKYKSKSLKSSQFCFKAAESPKSLLLSSRCCWHN